MLKNVENIVGTFDPPFEYVLRISLRIFAPYFENDVRVLSNIFTTYSGIF